MVRILLGALFLLIAVVDGQTPAAAQNIGDVFRAVNPSVVVIRAKGRDVEGAGGLVRFNETGSGVLVSADGKIMTAAHVVHSMDQIDVEFLGGEKVPARVISSEPPQNLRSSSWSRSQRARRSRRSAIRTRCASAIR